MSSYKKGKSVYLDTLYILYYIDNNFILYFMLIYILYIIV